MEILTEIIRELTANDRMLWVVGGGEVASENNSNGIKAPDFSNGWVTIQADNWHFHLAEASVNGIQFVEADSHGGLKSFYVRFSKDWEETLVRCYFPNPYLDDSLNRVDFQPERYQAFLEMRDRYVGREDGIVYVQR